MIVPHHIQEKKSTRRLGYKTTEKEIGEDENEYS
jgi:hypothetical protein